MVKFFMNQGMTEQMKLFPLGFNTSAYMKSVGYHGPHRGSEGVNIWHGPEEEFVKVSYGIDEDSIDKIHTIEVSGPEATNIAAEMKKIYNMHGFSEVRPS